GRAVGRGEGVGGGWSGGVGGVVGASGISTPDGGAVSPAVTGKGIGATAITPSTVDLASPPTNFTITGDGLVNLGFGLPVVNFMRGSTMLAQVRATALSGTTTLTVPFSPALTVGALPAQVYSQTSGVSYSP